MPSHLVDLLEDDARGGAGLASEALDHPHISGAHMLSHRSGGGGPPREGETKSLSRRECDALEPKQLRGVKTPCRTDPGPDRGHRDAYMCDGHRDAVTCGIRHAGPLPRRFS